MTRAAAVMIYFPSPSGFFGTGVIGKLSSVRRGTVAPATIFAFGLEEKKVALRKGLFPRP